MLKIPSFKTKKELFDFLVENKRTLINQKMGAIKHADAFSCSDLVEELPIKAQKSIHESIDLSEKDEFTVRAIINTTNIMDSHKDVHLKGLWSKSLKENKRIMHIQEHESSKFSSIIADGDDLRAFTKTYSWKDLGYEAKGETQALVFVSKIKKSRNPYMHQQYAKGYVNNHSVGMRYVKMALAINDESYEEYKVWQKYIEEVVNKDEAERVGYFYAVQEAKVIEGSAVPVGSNQITPTLSMKGLEPLQNTQNQTEIEAAKALQEKRNYFINLTNH